MNYILTRDLKLSRLHTIFPLLRGKWKFFFVSCSFIGFLKFWWNRWVSRHQNDFLTDWFLFFFQNRCITFHLLWASRAVPPTLALSHCEMPWQDKLHEHTQRPKSLRDKLHEPLPKVKLNSLFRLLMIKWQSHHFVWTIQWCQNTQLVTPHSEFDANFNSM